MGIFRFCSRPFLRLKYILDGKTNFCRHFTANISKDKSNLVWENLKHRSLIKLLGKDTSDFMQGVVTADVHQLEEGLTDSTFSCIYSMVLNVRGFVLCDIFLYKIKQPQDSEPLYLLECDRKVESEVLKHLKLYKLRKKIDISSVGNDMAVWAAFPDPVNITLPGEISSIKLPVLDLQNEKIISQTTDPRLSYLGYRIILQKDADIASLISSSSFCTAENDSKYKELRFKLGIGEGTNEHPPHKCFVQECNTDFLNGVSYHKGCYIGQEMVSRVHYTGVVRKRIMPIVLTKVDINKEIKENEEYTVLNDQGARVGKFRSHNGKNGLALLKISDAMKSNKLHVEELCIEFKALRPEWWPKDMTKE